MTGLMRPFWPCSISTSARSPGSVERNRLDIRDARALDEAERELVALRLLEPVPTGDFDLTHLKAIHCHLF